MEKTPNAGARKLASIVTTPGAQAELARTLSCSPSMVSYWLRGLRRPSPKMRAALEDRLQISWRLWDERGGRK